MNAKVTTPDIDGAFNPRTGNKDFFWYSNRIQTLQSTSPTATGLINIDADADFYCVAMSYQAAILTGATAAALTESSNVIPLVNLLITDAGSGKALSNNPIPIGSYMGDGKRPYRLIRPRVFAASATIQLNYTSFVAAGTLYDLTVVFHGYKVYIR